MLRVLPPVFKPVQPVNNLICCKTGLMWVVKRATLLFKSFCSKVAKQVARFLLLVLLHLYAFERHHPQDNSIMPIIMLEK